MTVQQNRRCIGAEAHEHAVRYLFQCASMMRMTSPAVMDRSATFISLTWPFHKATLKTAGVLVRWRLPGCPLRVPVAALPALVNELTQQGSHSFSATSLLQMEVFKQLLESRA